jgi:protein TonB
MTGLRSLNHWFLSASVHGLVILLFGCLFISRFHAKRPDVDITILDAPKPLPQAVTISRPKPVEEPKVHQVFGMSRNANTAEDGLQVKQGNTLAKAPDNEKLNPNDATALPVPTEDYLVTQMPELDKEIVIPYPPEVKKRGIQGVVTMDLLIDSGGSVRKVELVDGPDPELSAAAVTAAAGFKFKPARIQDKPVAVRIRYAYKFVIRG